MPYKVSLHIIIMIDTRDVCRTYAPNVSPRKQMLMDNNNKNISYRLALHGIHVPLKDSYILIYIHLWDNKCLIELAK